MVESWWFSIRDQFSSVTLDAMVVMPNHLHGIVVIGEQPADQDSPSLSDVMYWFKSITTHDYGVGVRRYGFEPYPGRLWQESFFDRILWEERDLERARAYIRGNPAAWAEDTENPSHSV